MQLDYGEMFRRIRRQSGLVQADFTVTGMNLKTISRFENAHTDPSLQNLGQLLHAVPVTMYEYLNMAGGVFPDVLDSFMQYTVNLGLTGTPSRHTAGFALRCRLLHVCTGAREWALRAAMLTNSGRAACTLREKAIVTAYLQRVEKWTAFEALLLCRSVHNGVLGLGTVSSLETKIKRYVARANANKLQRRVRSQLLMVLIPEYAQAGDVITGQQLYRQLQQTQKDPAEMELGFMLRVLKLQLTGALAGRWQQGTKQELTTLLRAARLLEIQPAIAQLEHLAEIAAAETGAG